MKFGGGARSQELLIGQAVGQVALLLAIPVLTRQLTLHEMGTYQAAFSIATVLQPLATLRRELLIPFSSGVKAVRHRRTGLVVAAALALVLLISGTIAWAFGLYDALATLVSTALVLMSFALVYVENAYLIRLGERRRLAARNLLGGTLSAGFQVVVAFFFPSAMAIALALLLGRAVATMVTGVRRLISDEEGAVVDRDNHRTVSAILSAMVASASSQAIVIGSFIGLGSAASAQVAIGQRIAGAPASLVGQGLTQVALADAAPLIRYRRTGLTNQLRDQTLRIAALAGAAAVALMVGAPILAVPVLGAGYAQAGILTTIFAVPLSLTLVALPATSLLIPLGRERLLFLLQVARLAAVAGTLALVSVATRDVIWTSLITSAVWSLAYIPLLVAAFKATAAHDRAAGD